MWQEPKAQHKLRSIWWHKLLSSRCAELKCIRSQYFALFLRKKKENSILEYEHPKVRVLFGVHFDLSEIHHHRTEGTILRWRMPFIVALTFNDKVMSYLNMNNQKWGFCSAFTLIWVTYIIRTGGTTLLWRMAIFCSIYLQGQGHRSMPKFIWNSSTKYIGLYSGLDLDGQGQMKAKVICRSIGKVICFDLQVMVKVN